MLIVRLKSRLKFTINSGPISKLKLKSSPKLLDFYLSLGPYLSLSLYGIKDLSLNDSCILKTYLGTDPLAFL